MTKVFLSLGEGNQVQSWGSAPLTPNDVEMEVEANDPFFRNYLHYQYTDGQLVKSSELEEQTKTQYYKLENKKSAEAEIEILKAVSRSFMGESETEDEGRLKIVAQQVNKALQMFAQTLDETKALEIADLYPGWQSGKEYKGTEIVSYGKNEKGNTQLYKVVKAHKSQADWLPGPAMESLYKKIGFTEDGTAIWVQPQGAHDAYKKGAIVMHNEQKWKSDVVNNTWEPGVYGWTVEP